MNRITEKALAWALETANDDTHGYSQAKRWGPDYDCSSFIISAYEQAGLPVREAGASYTGNMKAAFVKCGFTSFPKLPLSMLVEGDVLLNEKKHAVMYTGGGKVVAARSADGFPQSGDQSGREICVQDWYDFPWDCVLRYAGESEVHSAQGTGQSEVKCSLPALGQGDKGVFVKIMQILLISRGHSCGPDGADGDFGPNTAKALNDFQEAEGLTERSFCKKETWEALIK